MKTTQEVEEMMPMKSVLVNAILLAIAALTVLMTPEPRHRLTSVRQVTSPRVKATQAADVISVRRHLCMTSGDWAGWRVKNAEYMSVSIAVCLGEWNWLLIGFFIQQISKYV